MRLKTYGRVISSVFLLSVLFVLTALTSFGLGTTGVGADSLQTYGSVSYPPQLNETTDTNVLVDFRWVIGVNNLSLGFMLDWHRWSLFIDRSVEKQLARDANFKLIRIFDFRKTSQWGYPNLMPVTNWSESAKTGEWDWTQVDKLARTIFAVGAEPLFCLGWARPYIQDYIPPGMAVNPNTGLPYPESYAAYAKEWVKHFKTLGLPVRYYQIMNEPNFYFGWNPSDTTKLGYYVEVWNAAARAMRAENPDIRLSQDNITFRKVFDFWLQYGDNVNYLDFHKYDSETLGQYSDAEMFNRAEQRQFETSTTFYGVDEARQRWFNARGKWLPAINSESNFNSAWETGTDPKMQQITGAVWLALVLRTGILKGLAYNVYFEFSSSKSTQEAHGTGWGFGMTNEDDNKLWYPYYVNKMIGSNLEIGDNLIQTASSSNDVRSLGWINQGKLCILLINKVQESRSITLKGLSGKLNVSRIDSTVPYTQPIIQTSTINSNEALILNGYTAALLQVSITA